MSQSPRWSSPAQQLRPLLNPVFWPQAVYQFPAPCPWTRKPMLSLGEFGSRYLLSAEYAADGHIRLTSESSVRYPDQFSVDLPATAPARYEVGLRFSPGDRVMTITWNGRVVLRHALRFLVTARSQIHFGADPSLGNPAAFPGRIWPAVPQLFEAP